MYFLYTKQKEYLIPVMNAGKDIPYYTYSIESLYLLINSPLIHIIKIL